MNRRNFIRSGSTLAAVSAIAPTALGTKPDLESHSYPSIPAALIQSMKEKIKPVTKEQHTRRVELAKKIMGVNSMDALFMEAGTSLDYFSGVSWWRSERLFAMLIPVNGQPVYIAPKFEEARAKEQVGDARLFTWEENESPYALIHQVLQDQNLSRAIIGVEESTRFFVTENLQSNVQGLSMVNGTPITAGCRGVKTAEEIDLMQVANDITAEVYKWAVPQLKEGMTEAEFRKIISHGFSEFGVEGGALVLFGEASALPHGHLKENKLKNGDIVLIDGGCSVEGYESDITRTTVFGKPSEKMKKTFDIVLAAQSAALKAAKPGTPAELVDAAARKVITDAGYGPGYTYFTHRLGHGIGMDGHEWYYLVGGNKRTLQTGNMFSNEPGIYIPGEFGVRIEDEMLITYSGSKLLLPQAQSLEKMF